MGSTECVSVYFTAAANNTFKVAFLRRFDGENTVRSTVLAEGKNCIQA